MYSESHCHLGDMSNQDLENTEKQGFKLLLTSGIDLPSSEQAIKTAQNHKIAKDANRCFRARKTAMSRIPSRVPIDTIVVGGLKKENDRGKSCSRLSREGWGKSSLLI